MARPPRGAHPEAHPTRISQELAIVPKVRSLCNDGERRGTNIIHPQKKLISTVSTVDVLQDFAGHDHVNVRI
jgi:hypothetical protein